MSKNTRNIDIPVDWDRSGLPSWTYHSPALLELEKEELFKTHWQIACHVSDVPEVGDYYTFDLCNERAIIVRDQQNQIHVHHNICRHRGSRPIESEIWNGFVFVRFKKGPQPSVKELLSPFAQEVAPYKMEDRVPVDDVWTDTSPVNWKSVRDVDNEGYHVAMAHPALQDLYGSNYNDEPYVDGVSRTYAKFNNSGGKRWAVRNYTKMSKPKPELPENLQKAWLYYGIFPNAVIAATPETVLFYQEFPLSTGKTLLRSNTYKYREEDRQERASRYLTSRIDRETVEEDIQLTIWSNESMTSNSFEGFYLSDLEYGVRTHHNHLRNVLPIYNLEEKPEEAQVKAIHASLNTR